MDTPARPAQSALPAAGRQALALVSLGVVLLALVFGVGAQGTDEANRHSTASNALTPTPSPLAPRSGGPFTTPVDSAVAQAAQDRAGLVASLVVRASRQRPYLTAIGADASRATESKPRRVIVAVVDSGVDVTHPDFVGRIWENPHWRDGEPAPSDLALDCPGDRNGCAFVSSATAATSCGYQTSGPSGNVRDDNGHGTFVAGVVLAAATSGLGGSDAGDVDVRILPVKVLDCTGAGRASQAAAGVQYAARAGAQIIVLAFSGDTDSPALRAAVDEAQRTFGALVIAAAGNDGGTQTQFPSGYPTVLAVGGTGDLNTSGQVDYQRRAPFSNMSDSVLLLAPAVAILGPVPRALCGHRDWTCLDGGPYAFASGTSYAAALVAGSSARLLGLHQGLVPEAMRLLLTSTARPILGMRAEQVDLGAALALARGWLDEAPRDDRSLGVR
ncbi:MAG: hypothetical protein EPO65_12130 [Dehalococcoidia bacterium]|nr:MAG: hypothetical protein EPO65_12130 [Dehalococcoidia bacterium]